MSAQEKRIVIGRGRHCDVVLADESVSRRHAELNLLANGTLFIVDCQSQNGTFLLRSGQYLPIRQELVLENDQLRLGDLKVSVREILSAAKVQLPLPRPPALDEQKRPDRPPGKPWVQGTRLERCVCGAIKVKNGKCQECGQ
jgi:pSer/pThr/pTyr-binding forkhead associated (FHA) protein